MELKTGGQGTSIYTYEILKNYMELHLKMEFFLKKTTLQKNPPGLCSCTFYSVNSGIISVLYSLKICIHFITCLCACARLCVPPACRDLWGPKQGVRSLGGGVKYHCELPHMGLL